MTSPAALALGLTYIEARLKKTGRSEREGGMSSSDRPHAPGEGASEFVSRGNVSCIEAYRLASPAIAKSPDRNCSIPTGLSDARNSFLSPGSYGSHPTPLHSLPSSEARASELPSDGFQARFVRPTASSKPPITNSSPATADFNDRALLLVLSEMRKRSDLCGND
jgi:hypothetical protein